MAAMHTQMSRSVHSQDPDVAFLAGMIPHHLGAVQMAKVQLQYGKDDSIKALAQAMIDAQ